MTYFVLLSLWPRPTNIGCAPGQLILYYKIQSVCVCVSMYVCMLVRNRLQTYAHYGDETFAGDSLGLGLGHGLNFIFKTLILRYFWGKIAPDEKNTV